MFIMREKIKENEEKIILYSIILISIICFGVGLVKLNLILLSLSLIFGFCCFVLFKMWDFIENLIFRHSHLIQMFNGYQLNNDRYVAIRKINNLFSAVSIAAIKINENKIDAIKLENIIANNNIPFKIVIQIEKLNLIKLVNNLKTKLYSKQILVSKLEKSANKTYNLKINQLKREIEWIEHDIKNIEFGITPLKLCYYVMTSALSENKFIAEEESKHYIKNITNQFNAIFGSYSEILYGSELLRLLELDSAMVF